MLLSVQFDILMLATSCCQFTPVVDAAIVKTFFFLEKNEFNNNTSNFVI